MTNSMKQTVIKNPTWWKRRSTLERGLTVIAVCAVLLAIGFAIAFGVLAANIASCNVSSRNDPVNSEGLPSTANALNGYRQNKDIQVIDRGFPVTKMCVTRKNAYTRPLDY